VVEAKVAKSSIFVYIGIIRFITIILPFSCFLFMITKSEVVGLFASQILSSESKVMDVG
jgi:hypothetical protein